MITLRKAALAIMALSLTVYPLLLILVNVFAPHTINTASMYTASDPLSNVGQAVLFLGFPAAVAMLGLYAVLLLHRANPEWIRRQRVIALTATSLLAAAMAAVAFPVALFLMLVIGGTLR